MFFMIKILLYYTTIQEYAQHVFYGLLYEILLTG